MIEAAPQPQAMLAWMDGLADPTRLRLLRLLERQELGVAELCDVLQMPQSTVSRHLKLLADLRWCDSRRYGTANLYRMSLDRLDAPAQRLWSLTREQTEHWPAIEQDRLRLTERLRQRQRPVEAFFAGAARQWDQLRQSYYGQGFTQAGLLALLPEDWVVADLGCGTGDVTEQLAGHVKQVIGVDRSKAMLTAARRRLEQQPNVELRQGELEALPIETGSCDAAMLVLVLTYVAQPAAVLAEMARILKPAGRAVIIDLLLHDRDDFRRQMGQQSMGFEPRQLQHMLEQVGLVGARVGPLPPEPQAKGPALMLATANRAT